jgi:hypothetical protein
MLAVQTGATLASDDAREDRNDRETPHFPLLTSTYRMRKS